MPVQSVEALLDAGSDHQIRAEWAALAGAGLPSQAKQLGVAAAPHLTLSVAGSVPDFVEARLRAIVRGQLPVPVRLGPLVVMGSRRFVLARLLVPCARLLSLHAAIAEAMVAAPDVPDQVRPGRWTPHVTLARGLGSRQVGEALAVLGRTRPIDGQIESVRRWNPVSERAWNLGA
ncbi:2'-5' RNA ligase family protein [Monashia sp. NPDC004114]